VSLPPFFDRVADATLPFVAADRASLRHRVEQVAPLLALEDPALELAFVAAVDLAARFYGRLQLDAPEVILDDAKRHALAINPDVELVDEHTHRVTFGGELGASANEITVTASGWNVIVDRDDLPAAGPAGPALIAAGAIGIGCLFRCVFAQELPGGRTGIEPSSLNLITLREFDELPVPASFDLGKVHLAGAGAIGQAAVAALASANARGEIVLVDHEKLELTNVQRYYGTELSDIGAAKTKLAARKLESTGLRPREVEKRWGETSDSKPGRKLVLAALDTGRDRIGLQAGLHERIINAFTGPNDFGWSRHEHFGVEPCLACLYWPTGPRPHRYQVIAKALGQHETRIRVYRAAGITLGMPLPFPPQFPGNATFPDPGEVERWFQVPLLADIAPRYGFDEAACAEWASKTVDDLDRARCGGAVVRVDGASADTVVPLAHQSVLAGVMLAVTALASSDEQLRPQLGDLVQGRWDVRRDFGAVWAEPTLIMERCICRDPVFVTVWRGRSAEVKSAA
jgi:hypothetical protein